MVWRAHINLEVKTIFHYSNTECARITHSTFALLMLRRFTLWSQDSLESLWIILQGITFQPHQNWYWLLFALFHLTSMIFLVVGVTNETYATQMRLFSPEVQSNLFYFIKFIICFHRLLERIYTYRIQSPQDDYIEFPFIHCVQPLNANAVQISAWEKGDWMWQHAKRKLSHS